MLGEISFHPSVLLYHLNSIVTFTLLVSAYTDLRYRKVFNWLTFPAMAIALLGSLVIGGWLGGVSAALGLLTAFAISFPLFALHALGAGDVKLLMVLGVCFGSVEIIQIFIDSILVGAVFGVGGLIWAERWVQFLRSMGRSLLSLFVRSMSFEWPRAETAHKMPFGLVIALVTLARLYIKLS